jgi:hypothetical protein
VWQFVNLKSEIISYNGEMVSYIGEIVSYNGEMVAYSLVFIRLSFLLRFFTHKCLDDECDDWFFHGDFIFSK